MGYLFLPSHITRNEINHMKFILWGFKNVTGFIRWGTLHSLSVTSAGRPPVVGYPRLLIQRNRSCYPLPAGRLCQPQLEGSPYHTHNSRSLKPKTFLVECRPSVPTNVHTYTHTLQSLAKCCGRITHLPLIQSRATVTEHNTARHAPLTVGRSHVHTLFLWRHSST